MKRLTRQVSKVATSKNVRCYSTLKERGDKLDAELSSVKTPMERILLGKQTAQDLNGVNIKDSRTLSKWLNKFAKEGPSILTKGIDQLAPPVTVTVTGAAGQISYSLLFRIASGEMLGLNQPVKLRLLEKPDVMKALEGVKMELEDGAFPLLQDVFITDSEEEVFRGTDFAILVGGKPRTKGMERGDVLKDNAEIFKKQGEALNKNANGDVLVLVVANPANTNALITSQNAPDIPPENITAMTRLDHDRGLAQVALKTGCNVQDISRFAIWGNHSATQYPDLSFATINGEWAMNVIQDEKWIQEVFIPIVQKRGAQIIDARGKSSAASAADAAIKHMRDWVLGNNEWVSMAIPSRGQYGIPRGIWSSMPVQCFGAGKYGVIEGLPINSFSAEKINASVKELIEEKKIVEGLLPNPVYRLVEVDKKLVYSNSYIQL
ncbi:hypothetical protein ABK040_013999 [Willaertia magna]